MATKTLKRTYLDLMEKVEDKNAFQELSPAKKWKQLLDAQKPKHPPHGCALFVAEFAKKSNKAAKKGSNPRDLMRAAAHAWNNLSIEEKAVWEQRSENRKADYRKELKKYKRVQKAMKKPVSAFALFVKDRWKAEKAKGNKGRKESFNEVNKRIVAEWKKLSPQEKKKFEATALKMHEMFEIEQNAVLSGTRRFNLNWRGTEEPEESQEEE